MNVLNQDIDQRYALYQGDCVEVVKGLPDNSIHYSIFSPPSLRYIRIQAVTGTWGTAGMARSSSYTLTI